MIILFLGSEKKRLYLQTPVPNVTKVIKEASVVINR